ncbi:selenium-dependent molybdenum cofactor biosynthesis protein YqeB [Desulforhopalus singaporensis]|uniref:selenium-dependent molybdenum cofactor biosynthesis protein YqeB n=1 Tax=Desulforhopalus singaporensis TaxID=91360 RepID=UPI001FE0E472|nr:selenium-dependent molybdenum cofactor biosynthesis protein YqeB [Desulforhopalus singaporensis]
MNSIDLSGFTIAFKGAGEMASGVAVRLQRAGFRRIVMLELDAPVAVRRHVSFCEAVYDGSCMVEDIAGVVADSPESMEKAWGNGQVAVVVDPGWELLGKVGPDVVIDATLAKKNLGTTVDEAPLVVGLGPGFTAPIDVHRVIETNRGHDLGRIIAKGSAEPNTGIPGNIGGYTVERVLRAPADGKFSSLCTIGDQVKRGEGIGEVDGTIVVAPIDGVLRGLIRSGTAVKSGLKIGDIDPRGKVEYCRTVSEKSRAIGGAVLEAILSYFATSKR